MTNLLPANISISIDRENKRTVATHRGVLNKDGIIKTYHALFSADGYDPGYGNIVDYRGVSEVDVGIACLKDIFQELGKLESRPTRSAIVVGNQMGRLILAKLYCEMSGILSSQKIHRKAFQAMEKAEAWLDADG